MRIPCEHGAVLHYVDVFGLERRPFVTKNLNAFRSLRGVTRRIAEWPDLIHALGEGGPLKSIPRQRWAAPWHWTGKALREEPGKVLDGVVKDAWDSLGLHWEAFDDHLSDPLLLRYEGMTVWQYMTQARGHRTCVHCGSSTPPSQGSCATCGGPWPEDLHTPPFSVGDWEYVGRAEVDLPFEEVAFLSWLADRIALSAPLKLEIVGGMERLVEAFEQSLDGLIRRRTRVTGVALDDAKVTVHVESSAGLERCQFDYVVCAVPAGAVARIEFNPRLPPIKIEALAGLSYMAAAKTIVHTTKRYWELVTRAPWEPEERGGIYGGGSYTDLENQQCWYPSDNARAILDTFRAGAERGPVTEVDPVEPVGWEAEDLARSHEPGVFIAAYMFDTHAQRFASLSDRERDHLIISSVAEIHPWIRDQGVILSIEHQSWDAETSPGGGGFAAFGPGDQRRYQAALVEPWPVERSRVFFAGEHLAILHGWIQGAVQTGLAAAVRVLEAAPPP